MSYACTKHKIVICDCYGNKVLDLESRLAEREKEIERLTKNRNAQNTVTDLIASHRDELALRAERYREALEKISKVELKYDQLIGQIVGSEHYEAAWLDCCEIAKAALERSDTLSVGTKGRERD